MSEQDKDPRILLRQRDEALRQAQTIVDHATQAEQRSLTDAERASVIELQAQADAIDETLLLATRIDEARQRRLVAAPGMASNNPAQTGDARFVTFLRDKNSIGNLEIRASNDTDVNITTPADGGYAVPTGHYPRIIGKRDVQMLAGILGVMPIPGVGTTVNVPVDNEDDGEFVSTAEVAAYDRDAPALAQKQMTLVKYTKKIEMSVETDYDALGLLTFIEQFVGRGMAKTHNQLLLAEVAANGAALKNFTSNSAIAAGELEAIVGNDTLSNYLSDGASAAWVMRNSVHWAINAITADARFYYRDTADGLLGYPVHHAAKAAAIGAGAKSVYFGDWSYVGVREEPSFTVLRDPFTLAHLGQVRLIYMFRTVYKVLQPGAIGYGVHP
jgi:HK97 family phage major capsid protein